MRPRRPFPLLFPVLLGTAAVTAGYGAALLPGPTPGLAPWLLALGTAIAMIGAMALGARRAGRVPPATAAALVVTLLLVTACFALALALPPEDPAAPVLWLGLPRRAAVLLYGVGLLPSLILPVVYAATFDRDVLTEDDLARLRAARTKEGTP